MPGPFQLIFDKLRTGQDKHGVFVGDDNISLFIDNTEILRAKAAGIQVLGGGSFIQGSGVPGGKIFTNVTTTSVNTPYSVPSSLTNVVFSNFGAAAMQAITLPAIGTDNMGLQLEVVNQDSDGFRINAGAGQTIRVMQTNVATSNLSTIGGFASSVFIGGRFLISAVNTSQYYAWYNTGIASVLE